MKKNKANLEILWSCLALGVLIIFSNSWLVFFPFAFLIWQVIKFADWYEEWEKGIERDEDD